ncbi:MAG TPA: TetR/AcrR family transcriptional regulator [Myxococcota bacterium]|nr:TetR/AcrR family transcriptional regulator [Myxococcota bacterium]
MATVRQPLDFSPRKRPSQRRSRETFDALVEACAGLLARRGYAETTTNHIAERAGVNIASLYEYFPGKDAIVAQVAERLVERVLARLAEAADEVMAAGGEDAVRLWIERIHEIVSRERELVAVFVYQVPYTRELAPVEAVGARLLELSQEVRRRAGGTLARELSDAGLHLLINLVTSTILQCILDPPPGVAPRELLDELVRRVEAWLPRPR